ncbi:MAG: hypothetical protein CM1200mP14_14390 [Gammaproteobacteria bacterium]|nr:MAG: hypothetical protein CM1200mP14_14390 [Gammaproteobacteria bacterium]
MAQGFNSNPRRRSRIDKPYVNTMDFEQWAAPTENIQAILQREQGNPEPYRLLSFRQGKSGRPPALHGIELAAGHHPNDLSRYRELIGMTGSSEPRNLYENSNIRRLLNVKYIFGPRTWRWAVLYKVLRSLSSSCKTVDPLKPFSPTPVFREPASWVIRESKLIMKRSPTCSPIYLIPNWRWYSMNQHQLISWEPVTGEVSWIERTTNRLSLEVSTEDPALLVIADNWFPAWKAEIDGTPVDILRAYHSLRAIPISPGEHQVVLTYRSELLVRSLWISIILFFGIAGAAAFDSFRIFKSRRTS